MADYWKKKLDELNKSKSSSKPTSTDNYWDNKMTELKESKKKKKEEEEDIAPVRTTKKDSEAANTLAARSQSLAKFLEAVNYDDFAQNSGYRSTYKGTRGLLEKWFDYESKLLGDYDDDIYEYVNNQATITNVFGGAASDFRTAANSHAHAMHSNYTPQTESKYEENAYDFMTGEEVAVYNYFYNTEGKEKADEYLKLLEQTLQYRKAGKGFENIEGKTALEILYGAPAGLNQASQGIENFVNMVRGEDDYIPYTATQIVSGMVREDLADDGFEILGQSLGQVAYDGLTTASNMFPSIMLSTAIGMLNPKAGKAAGSGLMGVQATGNAYQEALNQGYSKEDAAAYAKVVGASEGGLQYALGGIGKLGGTSQYFSNAISGIENGVLRFIAQHGAAVVSEASEEALQEIINPLIKNATLGTDEDVNWSNVAYSGLLGGIMGEIMGGDGGDTTLTKTEQKVVDKEVENRIAEKESDGTKLTNREKKKIEESVISDMEKGYISTDTIESVLGGETYKTYKDTIEAEDALKKEFEELRQMKKGDMNDIQQDRLAELKEMNFEDTTKRDSLRAQLDNEILGLVNGSKLVESYNERTRRGQAFEADLTKYDAKQQETIKKAVESGILNNTNRTHKFVDFLAKISADKGVLFDFTNNERLKESGFAVDGKTVNGYVTKDGVTLNVQSAKALESVVGHEVTHILEGTEFYTELQNSLFEYAKSKNDYQGRLDSLTKLYEGIKDADVNAELTADLVGDYIFNDTDFVNRLSTENRNVFQKVYDEIKYLYKVATAGSQEARKLEKVKKAFEDAYRANSKASSESVDGSKYSIAALDNGNVYVTASRNVVKGTTKAEQRREITDFFSALLDGNQSLDIHTIEGDVLTITKKETANKARDDYKTVNGQQIQMTDDEFTVKMHIESHIDEIAEVSKSLNNKQDSKNHPFAKDGFTYRRAYFEDFDGQYYEVTLSIGNNGTIATVYNVGKIKGSVPPSAKLIAVVGSKPLGETLSKNDIPQESSNVKGKFSLSDTDGNQLSKAQQEYFKDSKMRDENGNLKVMYHGSPESFTEFDRKKAKSSGYYGSGFYFTDSDSHAKQYGNTYEVYLNITNPVQDGTNDITKEQLRKFVEAVAENEDYGIDNYGYGATVDSVTDSVYGKSDFAMLMDINASCVGNMVEAIELFNEVNGTDYNGIIAPTETVAFYPEQIKNVGNKKPTSDPDIRYSLTEYTEDEKKAHNKAVLDHFGKTYRWAETGYILLDGSKLDLSGKHEGAPGGYRTVDHRDIVDALGSDYGDDTYSGSLVQFMSEGNIRISPESDGINLSVKPNKAQEQALSDFISRARGEVLLDIDDLNGYTVVSVEYPSGTHANKVLNDIRGWFDKGTKPEVSNLSQFRSLSEKGEQAKTTGKFYGKDIALESALAETENVADSTEEVAPSPVVADKPVTREEMQELFPDDLAPAQTELDRLVQEKKDLENQMLDMSNAGDFSNFDAVNNRYKVVEARIEALDQEIAEAEADRVNSLDDADAPPEREAPMSIPNAPVDNPFYDRDFKTVGNKKVKAYMYEDPEVKPFFQEEAMNLLTELSDTTKGERWYNDRVYYDTGGEHGFSGVRRHTSDSIAELLDSWGMSYADIEKGLNAIIEDNGAENIAAAKKIEFMLNDRLLHGYKDFYTNKYIEPNQKYIDMLEEKQVMEYTEEARESFFRDALSADVAPVAAEAAPVAPMPETDNKVVDETEQPRVAQVMDTEPEVKAKKRSVFTKAMANFADKGFVFENLAKKTKNRELEGKYNFMHYSEGRAQQYIKDNLMPIVEKVEKSGKTKQLYEYMYHLHNIDRMSLEAEENRDKRESLREKFTGLTDKQIENIAMEWIKKDTPKETADRIKSAREYIDTLKGTNKPVFGESVTADISRGVVEKLELANPEFKELSQAIVDYNTQLRKMLVDGNVISQETADLWAKMYPHYVPIRRLGDEGLSVNVPLDTNKTGVNAPIKRAKGGSRNILPLFDTMAMRTEQTFKAIAKNSFGVELMHTLDSAVASEQTSLDEVIDSFDTQDGLLQEGKNGKKPTFTVFENGKRVTFEITEDMYDALKPTSDGLSYTNKALNTASNIQRGVLTEYNPVFMLTNAAKDAQDILINSQHPVKTYAKLPKALTELTSKGKWYQEYIENGGEQNTYFDSETKTFTAEDNGIKKIVGMPLRAISTANNFIERIPRLAEYIASREMGRSIEVSMLDAARVTTNFAAGGDVTKFLNRNGATFLNASVQGAVQQVRNIREAKMNGLKGWAQLAGKVVAAGLPAMLLNSLLWDDDEEYEELSDYVKQNYYVIAKTEDGKFIRIPKGRTVAVIQNAFEQIGNLITGNDEADLNTFVELVLSNLAPNNPIDSNIIAPIIQVANNQTWYGEDLVPTRLQDLPAAEQYDESTDALSKWLGENLNYSPYKLNYLLNQYGGGVSDVILPMLTPEAESGDNSFLGNMLAPLKDKFTTDSVMNNQNVSDFYDKMDELTTNAKSSKATDEDILKYKYINSVNAELSELYGQKREIQNGDLTDAKKYAAVKEIQQQINELAAESLNAYENVRIDGVYATVGDLHYKWYEPGEDSEAEPGWQKITDKQLAKQESVTSKLGISTSQYWSNKAEYDFAYEYPEKYSFLEESGIGYETYANADEDGKRAYSWAYENPGKYTMSKAIADDFMTYYEYKSVCGDFDAKDKNGKTVSGLKKERVLDYINGLNIDYGQKIILYRSMYDSKADKEAYNYDIVEYLNSRDDISYDEMVTILKELGMKVSSNGNVTW